LKEISAAILEEMVEVLGDEIKALLIE
jgi:hypothetical protein